MWPRYLVITTVLCVGCGGKTPSPPAQPEPAPIEAAPDPPVEPAPVEVEPPPEPAPVEAPEPPAPKPKPPPEPTCAELEKSTCQVTQGCEWHSVKKCLEQEKPKTLE
jgi:hypothetical protein